MDDLLDELREVGGMLNRWEEDAESRAFDAVVAAYERGYTAEEITHHMGNPAFVRSCIVSYRAAWERAGKIR